MSDFGVPARSRPDNRVLNIFRSVAALAVVFGHVRLLLFEDYSTAAHNPVTAVLYSLTSLGSEAVIVFFVMSGYWVGGSAIAALRAESFSWGNYASARLTRLWLVLIPALLLTLLLDKSGETLFASADVYRQPELYVSIPADPSHSPLTFIGNVGFLQDLYVPIFGTNKPLWSLAYEFWYYLLFPALLVCFWPGQGVARKVVGAGLAVLAIIISGPLVLGLFPAWALGAVVAGFMGPISGFILSLPTRLLMVARIAAILLIIGAAVAAHEVELPYRANDIILALVTALGMCFFVVDVGWTGNSGKVLSAASWTAHSSYSLYATHMPVAVFVTAILVPSFAGRWAIGPVSGTIFLGVIVLCCLIAYIFARFTERKTGAVRKWTKRIFSREPVHAK